MTLWRKLVNVERRVILNIFKTSVELLVGGKMAMSEGLNGTKKIDLRDEVRTS